ncbi:MAG TPA: acyltransferase [Planctomycetota bacterium]|nr:acyltransferase [Planctomycetota bacterium]
MDGPSCNATLTAPPPARLNWIEPAKGVAILMVVLYHTLGFLQLPNYWHGEFGVDAFVLLSGFGLAYASARKESFSRFLFRRLSKLLPAYYVVLALCVLVDSYAFQVPFDAANVFYHATCTHILAGEQYGFSINMSFWFMGMIVPLYLWFAAIRGWLSGPKGYAVLGASLGLSTIVGALIMYYGQWMGNSTLAHLPPRLPSFFAGAILGLMFQRHDGLAVLSKEPLVFAGIALWGWLPLANEWTGYLVALSGGAAMVAAGVAISRLGEKYARLEPLADIFAAVGALSFELYLIHQYLLLQVNLRYLVPALTARWPQCTPYELRLLAACISLVTAFWLAWGLRWLLARRECAKSWRPTARVLTAVTAGGAALLCITLAPQTSMHAYDLSVQIAPSMPASSEPILCFGGTGCGDLVYLEHDGAGHARIGVDHWSAPLTQSPWVDARALAAQPWKVFVTPTMLMVRAGDLTVNAALPPHRPNDPPVFGRNDVGFSTAANAATSHVILVAK